MPYGDASPMSGMRRAGALLIRDHPRAHFTDVGVTSQEELRAMLINAERHFKQLRKFGMRIVSYRTVINPDVAWAEDDFQRESHTDTVAYSASVFVPNLESLRDQNTNQPLQAVRRSSVEALALEPLKRYVDWGMSNKEPLLLDDIFTPFQFGWQSSTGVVGLHDPGPQMSLIDHALQRLENDLSLFEGVGH